MMERYLRETPVIDWKDPDVLSVAREMAGSVSDRTEIARRCFEFVRDEIGHCLDIASEVLTCKASDVLKLGTGYCYAKSHLLAALLRANGIPAGFCYQRLRFDDAGRFCLHGLNALYLEVYGWYRVDARGNKPGVDARFDPPLEKLAFPVNSPGEADFREIWYDPLPMVVDFLNGHRTVSESLPFLPDIESVAGK